MDFEFFLNFFVHCKKIIRIFAADMEQYSNIESAVCKFYKVEPNELYETKKSVYPLGFAKKALMYLYYANGMKVYDIAKAFGISTRRVFKNVAEVQVGLKSDTKIKEDIDSINQLLNI